MARFKSKYKTSYYLFVISIFTGLIAIFLSILGALGIISPHYADIIAYISIVIAVLLAPMAAIFGINKHPNCSKAATKSKNKSQYSNKQMNGRVGKTIIPKSYKSNNSVDDDNSSDSKSDFPHKGSISMSHKPSQHEPSNTQ